MSIDLQFVPASKVTRSPNPLSTVPTSGDSAQGAEWRTILEDLFQSEPEISADGEEVVPREPLLETSPSTPLLAIEFIASFFSKEALDKSSRCESTVEPKNDEDTACSEIVAKSCFLPSENSVDPPDSVGEFELSPNLWEFVPLTVLTSTPSVGIPEDSPQSELPSRVDSPDVSPQGNPLLPLSGPASEKRSDPQIVSAVFTIKTVDGSDDISRRPAQPDTEALVLAADEVGSGVPVRVDPRSQESPSESGENRECRDENPSKNKDVIPEDSAPPSGEASETVGGNVGFSGVAHRQPDDTRNRSTEARLSTVSFVSQVDAAMADPGEPTRPSSINLDLRISQGDLGLPDDSGAGELRLQLRQRGEEIQMRVHGTGEGVGTRAESEWAGLVERLRPQGLEAERSHFAVIPVSREPDVRPLHAVETMQREGSGNCDADGQRRQHQRDQRQEQHRNHQERGCSENETKNQFSSFLNG